METQRIVADACFNRATGGSWLVFKSAIQCVFINVYEHNGDFISRWQPGGFSSVKGCACHPAVPAWPGRLTTISLKHLLPITNVEEPVPSGDLAVQPIGYASVCPDHNLQVDQTAE